MRIISIVFLSAMFAAACLAQNDFDMKSVVGPGGQQKLDAIQNNIAQEIQQGIAIGSVSNKSKIWRIIVTDDGQLDTVLWREGEFNTNAYKAREAEMYGTAITNRIDIDALKTDIATTRDDVTATRDEISATASGLKTNVSTSAFSGDQKTQFKALLDYTTDLAQETKDLANENKDLISEVRRLRKIVAQGQKND